MGSQSSKKEENSDEQTINFHEIQSRISSRITNERKIVFQVSKDNNRLLVTPLQERRNILDCSYNNNIQIQKGRGLTCTVRSFERKQSSRNKIWKKKFVIKKMNITTENQRIFKLFMEFSKLSEGKILLQQNTKRSTPVSQLVGFHRQFDNFMCGGSQYVFLIFQEWGSYTLLDEIRLRKSQVFSQTLNISKQKNSLTKRADYSFKVNQIIKIASFLIEVAQQFLIFRQNSCFPILTLRDVLLLQRVGNDINMKYRHPLDSILFHQREFQRNYCNSADYLFTHNPQIFQSNMILQIGLCLLSLTLLQDCNQSCFSSSGQLCKSQLQNKIEQFYEIYQKIYQPQIVKCVSQIIHMFIFQAVQDKLMSISEAKSRLNKSSISARSLLIKNFSSTIECSSDLSSLSWGSKNVHKLNHSNGVRMLQPHNKQNLNQKEPIKKKRTNINPLASINRINMTTEQQRANNGKDYLSLTKIKNSNKEWNIEQSSQRKIIQINNTMQPRTRQWMIEEKKQQIREELKEKKACYDDIDQKWSQNEDLFKEMPDFWNFPITNSQFRQFGGSSILSMIPVQNSTLI